MLWSYAIFVAILNIIAITCALWFGTTVERKTENPTMAVLAAAGMFMLFGVMYLLIYNYITSAFVVTSGVTKAWVAAGGGSMATSMLVAGVYAPFIAYETRAKAKG